MVCLEQSFFRHGQGHVVLAQERNSEWFRGRKKGINLGSNSKPNLIQLLTKRKRAELKGDKIDDNGFSSYQITNQRGEEE